MKIIKSDLQDAAQDGIITTDQANNLWSYLESLRPDQAKFQALHVLYYFGAMLVLSSMSWFLINSWSSPVGIMSITASFALIYLLVGNNLWNKQNMKIPGGLLITAAVSLTPLFIYGFQTNIGVQPELIRYCSGEFMGTWLYMEIGTIIAALIALRFYKFTFLVFPLALSLWHISMDLTPILFGKVCFAFEEGKIASCAFGLVMLVASYFLDRKYKEQDFAFWTYLFGALIFWCSLTLIDRNSAAYCMINIGLIFAAVYLRRKIFMALGAIGIFVFICHLTWTIFRDSTSFPVVLTLIGIAMIMLGVKYQKNKELIEARIESWIPTFLNKWRPEERA